MSDRATREAVLAAYGNSPAWRERVNKMSDSQVVAIFMRLKLKGKIK